MTTPTRSSSSRPSRGSASPIWLPARPRFRDHALDVVRHRRSCTCQLLVNVSYCPRDWPPVPVGCLGSGPTPATPTTCPPVDDGATQPAPSTAPGGDRRAVLSRQLWCASARDPGTRKDCLYEGPTLGYPVCRGPSGGSRTVHGGPAPAPARRTCRAPLDARDYELRVTDRRLLLLSGGTVLLDLPYEGLRRIQYDIETDRPATLVIVPHRPADEPRVLADPARGLPSRR